MLNDERRGNPGRSRPALNDPNVPLSVPNVPKTRNVAGDEANRLAERAGDGGAHRIFCPACPDVPLGGPEGERHIEAHRVLLEAERDARLAREVRDDPRVGSLDPLTRFRVRHFGAAETAMWEYSLPSQRVPPSASRDDVGKLLDAIVQDVRQGEVLLQGMLDSPGALTEEVALRVLLLRQLGAGTPAGAA